MTVGEAGFSEMILFKPENEELNCHETNWRLLRASEIVTTHHLSSITTNTVTGVGQQSWTRMTDYSVSCGFL